MRCSKIHKKDISLFKSIKWTNPSRTDGILKVLVDGLPQEDEILNMLLRSSQDGFNRTNLL